VRRLVRTLALAALVCAAALPATPAGAIQPAQQTPSYYTSDQIIVTGSAAQVDALILALPGSSFRLVRVERSDLSYLGALGRTVPLPFAGGRSTLVMDLYRILDATDPAVMVSQVNDLATVGGYSARADANYAVGRPPLLATGDPWSVGADPAAGSSAAAGAEFWKQYALGQRGIELMTGSPTPLRMIPFEGARVRVGVFDTSPFSLGVGVTRTLEEIDWISPTLALDLRHPPASYTWPAPAIPADVSDHGLFVAGLVHAVAPQSSITLSRVLDTYGQGDLYTLTRELHAFNREVIAAGTSLDGAVINLSLGVHPPPNAAALGLPPDIIALLTAIQGADGFGIVVVAAAGNDSNLASVAPLQLPGAYPSVIGVAGSSAQRGRSCFSNSGDIAAPGGNGVGASCTPPSPCPPACANQPISIVLPGAGESGYAYWPGTSFASPLVAGAAALVLDAHDGALTPPAVSKVLADTALPPLVASDTAALGAGIINLRRIFLPFQDFLPTVMGSL
jgi:subtilisin family serine protease